ncbi:Nonsense-mediated mRNA 3 [Carabus blaptoides fortunei]
MEYIDVQEDAVQEKRILCCECGTVIAPNPSNMCVGCLRSHVDITDGIPKQVALYFCRGCERYLNPPAEWVPCALESRELLTLCLKKLKGLNRVKLIDAGFVWTEPHSKRIKIKLTVHAEVSGGAVLQQVFVVDYLINHHMCDDCHRSEAQDFWRALVQVRQKAENKKTFYYLEQLILKHKAHENTLGIKPIYEGLDFFYATEAHARKMVDFITTVLPCRYQHSKKLISHDIHSNIYNYKFTYCIEIVPISKDSIVCLPKKLTQQLGGISPVCLVYRVTNSLHLIDPSSAQITEVNSTTFWRYPFNSICNPKQLVEYVVMDIEPITDKNRKSFPGQGAVSTKHILADVCYNVEDSNINDSSFDKLDRHTVPDVILVKKQYGDRSVRRRMRNWKLKHLAEESTAFNQDANDYNEFLDELEEDPTLRQNINIFKDATKQIPIDDNEMNDPSMPHITLAEMLDDLQIEDVEMAE